jgi:hypothetical protein
MTTAAAYAEFAAVTASPADIARDLTTWLSTRS